MTNVSNRACGVGFTALAACSLLRRPLRGRLGQVSWRPATMVIAILFARAVSDSGDLVTGELLIGKRGDASIRLMPVGFGYRYAAQGLRLDGWRGNSELHFGKPSTDRLRFTPG